MRHTLEESPVEYIETPKKQYNILKTRKGGKDSKMSKNNNTSESKAPKKYNKTRGEHIKDVIIAMLITGILAFAGGMQFANTQNEEVQSAVSKAQTATAVEKAPVKK